MRQAQIISERSLPPWDRMLDIPAFLDSDAIDLLYDGLVRPMHTNKVVTITTTSENADNVEKAFKAHGKGGPGFFSDVFAKAEAGVEAQVHDARVTKTGDSTVFSLEVVNTPVRRLEQIAFAYHAKYPDRVLMDINWRKMQLERSPKYFGVIDLPPGAKIIPTAAEFTDGSVVKIFPSIAPPGFDPNYRPKTEEDRHAYWQGFADVFDAQTAMEAIEKAQNSHGKISWIDFRTQLGDKFVHVHIVPRGRYDTGVFAYNFVKRGYKHGISLVGVLRSEPDLHVLAIYEA